MATSYRAANQNSATEPLKKGNTTEAVEFLVSYFDGRGPYLLTAIAIDGTITTRLFRHHQVEKMRKWIELWQGKTNVYFHANAARDGWAERAKKTDIAEAVGLYVDADPREGYDRDAERARILASFLKYEPLPTWIVDSGNGYQAGWIFAQPVAISGPEDIEAIESRNRYIRGQVAGGDKCQEIAHLFRVPGTVNLPTATKVKRGYTVQVAKVHPRTDWDRVYQLEDFPRAKDDSKPKREKRSKQQQYGAGRFYQEGVELVLPPEAASWLEGVIRTGDREDGRYHGEGGSKNSDAVWAVVNELLRLGWDDASIRALITDPQWPLSAHCLKDKDPQWAAQRQIERARDKHPLPQGEERHQAPVMLGYTHDHRFAVLIPQRQIIELVSSAKLFTLPELLALAPYDYWSARYGGEEGKISLAQAAQGVMRACDAAGPYDNTKVRGRGVWREGGRIIVNLDRALKTSDHGYTYLCFQPIEIEATAEFDTARLLKLLKMFRWRNANDAYLFLGWLAMAPVCGVIAWRPHVWVHGLSQTGKSTLFEISKATCSPLALATQGDSTEAGIRQKLGADSLPVLLDETEKDSNRLKAILRLARIASSATDAVYRGTPEGRAQTFSVQTTFALFGTRLQGMTPADQSRFITPALLKHDQNQKTAEAIAYECAWLDSAVMRGKWCSLMVNRAALLPEAVGLFESVVDGDRRHQQNMGALLGCAFVALHGKLPSKRNLETWAGFFAQTVERHAEELDRNDALECLDYLRGHIVRSQVLPDHTLGHWIRVAAEGGGNAAEADRIVALYGLRIIRPPLGRAKSGEESWLCVSNRSVQVKQLYEHTPWSEDGWRETLRKLDGSAASEKPMKFDTSARGTAARATKIPLGYFASEEKESAETEWNSTKSEL